MNTPTFPAAPARWRPLLWPLGLVAAWLVALLLSGPVLGWGFGALPRLLGVALAALALYVLPGLAVLRWLWPNAAAALTGTERAALAVAVSAALPPLVLELLHLVKLPWSGAATVGYVAVAVVALLPRRRDWPAWHPRRWPISGHALLLGALVGLAALVRLFVIRDLPSGLWGDSYQHTMMAQLLVDHGGLFQSWQPYAPLTTFTYHFGFHANVAFWHWLTGTPVTQSLLVVGQLLGVATVPLAYALTARFSGHRGAGLWAAVFTGFVNLQPAFYVNWGRYTQLAGQVILPLVLVVWMAALEAPRPSWRLIALAALSTAGLLLTHYVVTIFAAVLVLAYLVMLLVRTPAPRRWWRLAWTGATIGAGTLLLAAPWLWNTLNGYLAHNVASVVGKHIEASRIVSYATLDTLPPRYINRPLLLLAGFGALVALIRRHWHMTWFVVWSAGLILTVVPQLLGVPGTGIVNFFTAAIALYVTVLPLAAYGVDTVVQQLRRWAALRWLGPALLLALSIWGVRWQQGILDLSFMLLTPADAAAMTWIKGNTPTDALFLVNSFPAYGDTLEAGDDGGWWLPLLTGRRSTLPPLTYGSERAEDPRFVQQVKDFANALRRTPLPDPAAIALCRQAGVRYIYDGPHVQQPAYRLNIAALRRDPAFAVVYEQGGVTILALRP